MYMQNRAKRGMAPGAKIFTCISNLECDKFLNIFSEIINALILLFTSLNETSKKITIKKNF